MAPALQRSIRGYGIAGLLAGVICLLYLQGCSSPELKPWHTRELDAEFTAGKADQIQDFADYLHLEQEVFRQLDEEVFRDTPTGPGYALVRYSAGSAADPPVT